MEKTIEIPEGYEARIEGNKIILELKESEDERIRQDIITTLSIGVSCKESALHPGAHTILKEAISWLEKQGSQKPAWNEEDEDVITTYLLFVLEQRDTDNLLDVCKRI